MKDTQITVRLSEIEKEKIKALAAEKDIPLSQIVREAIKKFL
jgi:predicted DNA binding CopG/RHH family protein